jgi:hypothetical protein
VRAPAGSLAAERAALERILPRIDVPAVRRRAGADGAGAVPGHAREIAGGGEVGAGSDPAPRGFDPAGQEHPGADRARGRVRDGGVDELRGARPRTFAAALARRTARRQAARWAGWL